MTFLLQYFLALVNWESLRAIGPGQARKVPDAVRRLVSADSETDATAAYWELDNNVVVQGQLFEAARPLIPVLLAAVAGELTTPARLRVVDLIVEIASGRPDESEVALANTELGRDCRSAVRAGVWLFYEMLVRAEAPLRKRAVQIIYAVDEDRTRVADLLQQVATADPDPSVRATATEFQRYMPNVIYDEEATDGR
jgi:hypothetical protein